MRVLLISANRTEIYMRTIPLGLAFIAKSLEKAGHIARIIDCVGVGDMKSYLQDVIDDFRPEAIGISIRNIDDQTMRDTRFLYLNDRDIIALTRKLSGSPIILGGAGYSIFPRAILEDTDADMGIAGEGEASFPLLLDRLQNGQPLEKVPGLYVKGSNSVAPRQFTKDLADYPLPDPAYLMESPATDNTWVPIQTRRGCSMTCSYCSTSSIEGVTLRKRPIESVIEWLRQLKEAKAGKFYFVDNTFNFPRSYALALCREITKIGLGIKWRCIVYPWRIDDELVSEMAHAGCMEISLGSESGDDTVLSRMNKRFRQEDVINASYLFKKYGIKQMGFLMLGAPGETRRSVEDTLKFAGSLDFDSLKVTVGIRIYPNTKLFDEARMAGIISPDDTLLYPRFYFTPGLDEEWVRDTIARYATGRLNWIMA